MEEWQLTLANLEIFLSIATFLNDKVHPLVSWAVIFTLMEMCRAATNDYLYICRFRLWSIKCQIIVRNARRDSPEPKFLLIQIACFVQPIIQNPEIFSLPSLKAKKTANIPIRRRAHEHICTYWTVYWLQTQSNKPHNLLTIKNINTATVIPSAKEKKGVCVCDAFALWV